MSQRISSPFAHALDPLRKIAKPPLCARGYARGMCAELNECSLNRWDHVVGTRHHNRRVASEISDDNFLRTMGLVSAGSEGCARRMLNDFRPQNN